MGDPAMIDITKLDPAQLDRFIHLQSIIARQSKEAERVRAYRAYYRGDHPVHLSQRQQEYLGTIVGDGEFAFSHNIIKVIIDTLRERLHLEGFTVNGQGAGDADSNDTNPAERLAGLLWQWFNANRMGSQQVRLYRRALRDGKSYVMVDFDVEAQRPRLTLHKLDDGQKGIMLHRDPEDENRVLFATRYFYTFDPLTPGKTGKARKTVYLPHEIRKYEQGTTADAMTLYGLWRPVMDDGDPSWPIPWVDANGRPLGVAVIEFENPGGSEINNLAGLQNGLNKSWLDLYAAADAAGFPIITVNYDDPKPEPIGIDDDEDLEGEDEFIIAPARALEIFGGEAKRLDGANLDSLIETVWTSAAALGGVSRTPQYYLKPLQGAQSIPSGEALKMLESGLVSKATERQDVFEQSWADVMSLAYRVARTFGPALPEVAGELNIGCTWRDPNTRMEETEAKIAEAHDRLQVPKPAVWRKAGYRPEEIAIFEEQVAQQRAVEVAAVVGAIRGNNGGQADQTAAQQAGTAVS